MKIKYYPRINAKNRLIGKTPELFEFLDKWFLAKVCRDNDLDNQDIDYNYTGAPIFYRSKLIANSKSLNVDKQIQISSNRFLTEEELKLILKNNVVDPVRVLIKEQIISLAQKQRAAIAGFKEGHDNLDYIANNMEKEVNVYKIRQEKIAALEKGNIVCIHPLREGLDEYGESCLTDYLQIIPDAKPIAFDKLLKDIFPVVNNVEGEPNESL